VVARARFTMSAGAKEERRHPPGHSGT
jgi:hypothetical protein